MEDRQETTQAELNRLKELPDEPERDEGPAEGEEGLAEGEERQAEEGERLEGEGAEDEAHEEEEEEEESEEEVDVDPDSLLPPTPPDSDVADDVGSDGEPKPPPVTAKLFMLPRDYRAIMEIEVIQGSKEVNIRKIGKEMGPAKGKFVHSARARNTTNFYCVPYGFPYVLEIDPILSKWRPIGGTMAEGVEDHKYTSAVVCGNWHGRLYAAPCRAKRVLEIDPDKGTAREVGPVLGSTEDSKWYAISSSPRGRIYAIPYDAHKVLEIDPTRNGAAREIGPDLGIMRRKYKSCALAANGDIYCAPLNAPKVLRITAEGVVQIVGPDFGKTERKYACIVAAPNKLLYAPPLYADKVIEINCVRGDTRTIGDKLGAGEAKYACAAVAENGRVYCAPLEARRVLEINCIDHEVREIGMDIGVGEEKYCAIASAPLGGKLYAAPRQARCVLEIDPVYEIVREVGEDLGSMYRKFAAIATGLTHDEIKKAGKDAVARAAKALEWAQRAARFAQKDIVKRQERYDEALWKYARAKPIAEEAEAEAQLAAEEEKKAREQKEQGSAFAAVWIRCRDEMEEKIERAKKCRDRAMRFEEDLERQTASLEWQQKLCQDKEDAVAKAQQVLDVAIEAADLAAKNEAEARRQKAELDAELAAAMKR